MQLMPVSLSLEVINPISTPEPGEGAKRPSFGELLNQALTEINAAQLKADQLEVKFFTGEVQDLHQVMIAKEEARLMISLAVEIRNRVVEAYQEISRMQI